MYRAAFTASPEARRGIILLVVLFMLTLFAIAGLSLVLYANAEATAARTHSEAANFRQPDMEPEVAFSYFLGQLIYDCLDDETGIYSALRGHSLARNMYGLNTVFDPARNRWVLQNPFVPYHGPGRLHFAGPLGIDDYVMVNYRYWPADGFLRDPEHVGWRADPTAPRSGFYVGGNVSYTYPDLNNMFLAAARADGTVLIPSFHRDWTGFGSLAPNNPNWTNQDPALKYLVMRPRPVDQLLPGETWPPNRPFFPLPEDATGDVKNWPWAPGGNDSIWIDIDAPVLTTPDGRKYKMLVAPLIIDLDGRINVNVHGNVLGAGLSHRSNQGWGPWEINPAWILRADGDPVAGPPPNEWKNLIVGRPYNRPQSSLASWPGRFGANLNFPFPVPRNGQVLNPFAPAPHPYAPIDFDGTDETNGNPTGRMQLPASPTAANDLFAFPRWLNGYGNGSFQELRSHPLLYDPFKPPTSSALNDDRSFEPHNLAALFKVRDTNSDALQNCDLLRLCPLNLNDMSSPAARLASERRRRMLTTASFDLDQPGITPYIWDPADPNTAYRYDAARGHPVGAAIPFPNPVNDRPQPPPANSEFAGSTWHSLYAGLGRLNLDRPLRNYPDPDATSGVITNVAAYNAAAADRVATANDLFFRLRLVTGAADPNAVAPDSPEYHAVRWLAQLAVNIVDYIDADDYITVFTWSQNENDPNPEGRRVYGTELPRLVLNEAYVQFDNRPEDVTAQMVPATGGIYRVNFWIELHNPFPSSPALSDSGNAVLQVPNGTTPYAAYKIQLLHQRDPNLRNLNNTAGEPDQANDNIKGNLTDWGTVATNWVVQASNGAYSGPPPAPPAPPPPAPPPPPPPPGAGTQGFYVVGPTLTRVVQDPNTYSNLPATFHSDTLTYDVFAADNQNPPTPTILLRRLACPRLPPNPPEGGPVNDTLPLNPYITVDYMEDVAVNDGRLFTPAGAVQNVPPVSERLARGKSQPYASFNHPTLRLQAPMPSAPATPPQPRHTFYRHNAVEATPPPLPGTPNQTLKIPFDWLVHLDRRLISPVELLNVSAYKPHELTQRFYNLSDPNDATSAVVPFQHLAPWQAVDTRIARLFSLLKTRSRYHHDVPYVFLDGVPQYNRIETTEDGRVPGKININTIWDEEIFQALCDAGPSNSFTAAEVSAAWQRLLARRTPTRDAQGNPIPGPVGIFGATNPDRPFLDVGTGHTEPPPAGQPGQYPFGVSVNDTVLSPVVFGLPDQGGSPPPPPRHPYQRHELLNKIYNNVTVRSNVFAVWATVGFFEVIDDSTKPVKLGAEIGRAEGRHVRHRMFAVVDRTNLSLLRGTLGADVPASANPPPPPPQQPPQPQPRAITAAPLPPIQTSPGGLLWQFVQGQPVIWGPDTLQAETTPAVTVDPTFLTTRPHTLGSHLIVPGNPGPWADYDPRRDGVGVPPGRKVVPYWAIID
jgi:hypothetical protein